MVSQLSAKFAVSRFVHFLVPYWFRGLVVMLCLLFTTVSSLAPPYIIKVMIDDIFPSRQFSLLLVAIGVLLSITLINIVLSIFSDYLYAWAGNRIVRDIRLELFRHLMNLPVSFHLRHKSGDLIFRLNSDVAVIQTALTSSLLNLFHKTLTLIGLATMLCYLNPSLFFLSILVIPFFVWNLIHFQPKVKKIVESIQIQGADIFGHVIERFNQVPLIQLSNKGEDETKHFHSVLDRLIASTMQNVAYSISMGTVSSGLIALTPLIILVWGGYHVMQDVMTIGALVAFLQYASRLFGPVRQLHDLYIWLVRALVSMRRVLEFLQVPTQIAKHQGRKPFIYNRTIELQDVYFTFECEPLLQGVNFKLTKGKTYALVGVSGSGKTTVANLLCGFYNPDRGSIYIDDVPLDQIRLPDTRKHVGLVTQQAHLFRDSIWENIRYGNLNQKPEEIERIIRRVGLDGTDMHADIGEQGSQVSGGQQQRIALARALLRPVELLILDEATTALDPVSEENVLKLVKRTLVGKTLLVISHSFRTVCAVDEVICLSDGRVVEQAPPEELLRRPSYLSRFFQRQQDRGPDGVMENAG